MEPEGSFETPDQPLTRFTLFLGYSGAAAHSFQEREPGAGPSYSDEGGEVNEDIG
jgi:hypothetical protein